MEERVAGRYCCKYCKIWVADNKAQRAQHETGLKHLSARENALREIGRNNDTAKREREQGFREAVKAGADRVAPAQQKQFQAWRSGIHSETIVNAMELVESRKAEIAQQSPGPEQQFLNAEHSTHGEDTEAVVGNWIAVHPDEQLGLPEDASPTRRVQEHQRRIGADDDNEEQEAAAAEQDTKLLAVKDAAELTAIGAVSSRAKRRKYRKKTGDD